MSNYFEDYETSFRWISIRSTFIKKSDELRLSANSYSPEVIKSMKILELLSKKFELMKVNDFSEKIFVGARSKRLFTTPDKGVPYLSPTDVFLFNLKPRKYVSRETKDIENWWVEPYTILITQSGSVGRSIIVNDLFRDKVVSPNMIRVFPNTEGKEIVGYIYAFINTWVGQALLTKTLYGITVKHIEPYHVANLNIPLLHESDIKEINNEILKAYKLREKAQELLIEAERLFYEETNLPEINEISIEYLGEGEEKYAKVFTIRASMLDLRLDASYHIPIVGRIFKVLMESGLKLRKIRDVATKIFIPPRFKRPYTSKDKGVPYLQPSHLPMIRYFDLKYLYPNFKNSCLYKLKAGQILVVTDGTVGWVSLVTDYISGWFGSNNFARLEIQPDINLGYLLAFLLSPYGQVQLKREIFGGVVDHITEAHIGNVVVPEPPDNIQRKIGEKISKAYSMRDEAIIIENMAINRLERLLVECSK